MQFEWNEDKALENAKKHRVSFEQAQQVFDDPRAVPFEDLTHSRDEARYVDDRDVLSWSIVCFIYISRRSCATHFRRAVLKVDGKDL